MSAAGDNLVVPDLVSFSSVCQAYTKVQIQRPRKVHESL
jgi:hypothetical protein